MKNPNERVERAISLTPKRERARRATEWRSDLSVAEEYGPVSADEVAKGALRVARVARRRSLGAQIVGAAGARIAAIFWAVITLLGFAAWIFGGALLLMLAISVGATATVLVRASSRTTLSHVIIVISTTVMVACGSFAWWTINAASNAADNFRPEPPLARWGGVALLGALFSAACAFACIVRGMLRAAHRQKGAQE